MMTPLPERLAPVSCRLAIAFALLVLATRPGLADEPVLRPLQRSNPSRPSSSPPAPAPAPAAQQSPPAATPVQPSASTDAAATQEHPLRPAIRIAESCLESLQSIQDYEALLIRREFVNGKSVAQTMQLKFREQPFSVYLKFGGDSAGREVLYVEGMNNNQLLAHEGSGLKSFIGTVSVDPNSALARAESRHSLTQIGLRNLLRLMIGRWEGEARYGECEMQYYQDAKLDETRCLVVECTHPRPRKQFKFHVSRLFIDKSTNLPVRVENYDFPVRPGEKPPILEEYTYSKLRTNVGLNDTDFSRNNPAYRF